MIVPFNNDVRVRPQIYETKPLPSLATVDQIESEPMVYGATPKFAYDHGGPLTKAFLEAVGIEEHEEGLIVDTRSHMLMPGMLPAIGGWHCDGYRRGEDGQPDLVNPPKLWNWTYTVATESWLCNTEFLFEPITLNVDMDLPGSNWSKVHRALEAKNGCYFSWRAPHGKLVHFQSDTLHRATKADRSGWRFFARCSQSNANPANKIRKQVQVYIEAEGAGW